MKFSLTAPCGNCPFRNDGKGIRLRRARAQDILESITEQQMTFSCHKTVAYHNEDDEDDDSPRPAAPDEEHCAGALILLEHMDWPNQMMRWMERLGFYDRTKLRMDSPVFADGCKFVEWHNE